jgi:hypothetical protein
MATPKKETPNTAPAETPAETPDSPAEKSSSGATTAQATAAVSDAVGAVRERLVAGEQFLLDYRIFIDSFPVVLAVLTVLAIWVHRWGHYDFGSGYRILIGGLGVTLALFALMSLLAWARLGGNSADFMHLIGRLLYWACGVAAFMGGWRVFRTRES